jgi:type VI secretion system protein VasG
MLALMSDEEIARMLIANSEALGKISLETLTKSLGDLVAGSREDAETGAAPGQPPTGGGKAVAAGTKSLDLYTINLTEKARKGEIDPVLGRDAEIRQMIDILIRRRQNNPILTGEAGVGKTAVVEGFALRIVEGDVPPPLRNVEIRTLDLGLLQAGAGIKGEFENRLKSVIEEVKGSPIPIIIFIDEAHTLIGAGGSAGSGDAANLLKPPLARGELRTIAATTWSEYKKYFEKDAALARRFQVVKVEEPDEEKAVMMMQAIAPFLEKHHKVMVTAEALRDAVRLSRRYLPSRQLPDKAVSVLDTACARVAIGLTTCPPSVEEMTRRIGQIEREEKILEREALLGGDTAERLKTLSAGKKTARIRLDELNVKWHKEEELALHIIELQNSIQELHALNPSDKSVAQKRKELKKAEQGLKEVQGNDPLLQTAVDPQIISEVISGWTGIPTGRMLVNEIDTVLNMDKLLGERIIGQDHALKSIAQMIRTAHAGIEDPSKPTAVFLFVGPSGVGKTETALALSELLYGGQENVITINMSEYQEAHTVSGLKGSPPGYVGYGEGGVLTEAVRKRPYSVVLLDEVEKAHPDVMELFYQVFDKGSLEDGEGRKIDFKNTVIILTSNLATDTIMKVCADEETMPDWQSLTEMLRPELLKHFKPAFLGRLKIVPYYPITDANMRFIVKLKLNKVAKRMKENRNVLFVYDDSIIEAIASRCTEVESGARNVDHILTNTLLPEMSRELLARMASGEQLNQVKVTLEGQGFAYEVK